MTPEKLSENLDKIKMPQNFLLIKSVNGVFEHQNLINKIQIELDKYFNEYWKSKFLNKKSIYKIIPQNDICNFKFCDDEENYNYYIIDYTNFEIISVVGSYDKTVFNKTGTEIHVYFKKSKHEWYNYNNHAYDDIYKYRFSIIDNSYLGVRKHRKKFSNRNRAPYNDIDTFSDEKFYCDNDMDSVIDKDEYYGYLDD